MGTSNPSSTHRRRTRLAPSLAAIAVGAATMLPTSVAAQAPAVRTACLVSSVAQHYPTDLTLHGIAADHQTPGVIRLGGVDLHLALTEQVAVELYDAGLIVNGTTNFQIRIALRATSATANPQIVAGTASITWEISDPDGIPGTGDETAAVPQLVGRIDPAAWQRSDDQPAEIHLAAPGSLRIIDTGSATGGPVAPVGGLYLWADEAGPSGQRAAFDCRTGDVQENVPVLRPELHGVIATIEAVTAPPTSAPPVPTTGMTIPGPDPEAPSTTAVPAATGRGSGGGAAPTGSGNAAPRGPLATTGLSTTTVRNALIAIILLDLGYLAWSSTRPASRAARGRGRAG